MNGLLIILELSEYPDKFYPFLNVIRFIHRSFYV